MIPRRSDEVRRSEMKKYACYFCGEKFTSPVERMEHISERGSRCSIAGGHMLLEMREKARAGQATSLGRGEH